MTGVQASQQFLKELDKSNLCVFSFPGSNCTDSAFQRLGHSHTSPPRAWGPVTPETVSLTCSTCSLCVGGGEGGRLSKVSPREPVTRGPPVAGPTLRSRPGHPRPDLLPALLLCTKDGRSVVTENLRRATRQTVSNSEEPFGRPAAPGKLGAPADPPESRCPGTCPRAASGPQDEPPAPSSPGAQASVPVSPRLLHPEVGFLRVQGKAL